MKKVMAFATDYDILCQDGLKMLQDFGCEVVFNAYGRPYTFDELKEVMSDVDAVIANMEQWNGAALDASPNLKVIARFGTGYDSVDLVEAKNHGVVVTNCPGLNAPAVAEHAIALILSALRRIPELSQNTKQGGWKRVMYRELSSCTVGILGFGAVGHCLAEKLQGFGCKLLAYDVKPDTQAAERLNIKLCSFEEVMSHSDIISIHMPLFPETNEVINDKSIALCKPGVIMVNTARGPLIDEAAVSRAIEGGILSSFACDVMVQEPADTSNPILKHEGFICTPHVASQSYENYCNTGIATAQAIIDVLSGKEPKNRKA